MDELVIFNNIIIKNCSEIKQNKSNYKAINTYMKNLSFYIKRLGGGTMAALADLLRKEIIDPLKNINKFVNDKIVINIADYIVREYIKNIGTDKLTEKITAEGEKDGKCNITASTLSPEVVNESKEALTLLKEEL